VPFETGDIVYLVSGSPPMTVSDMKRRDGLICVEYFTGFSGWWGRWVRPQRQSECFHAQSLTRIDPRYLHQR
jgi:uncharacterized protein YodC (DUF2158 family)